MTKEAKIQKYLDLLLIENETTNLTRITSREQAQILHIEDSLVGLPEVNESPAGLYGDLGTGGGFPGVPLAIMTERPTLLVDSVKKKVAIVENVVRQVDPSLDINVYGGRIEDLAKEYPGKFSVLTARALSKLVSLIELSSPLLKKGGRLVCYKANVEEDEINAAIAVENLTGMKLISRRSVLLSDNETHREIIVFEKVAKPSIKLPRRIGMAQKNPLEPRK